MTKLAIIVPFFSFVTLSFGMIDQIRLIRKHQDAKEVSLFRAVMGVMNSLLWLLYSREIHNHYLALTNIIAIVLGTILTLVIWKYQK